MPVEELIKQLQALPSGTKVLIWIKCEYELDGYYAVELSDLDEAKQHGLQFLRAKGGDIKFVAVF